MNEMCDLETLVKKRKNPFFSIAYKRRSNNPSTTGRSTKHATQFRGTFRAAGGPAVELAAEPRLGEADQGSPSARSSLHRRHRLSCGAGLGQTGSPIADQRFGLGTPPATHFSGGSDRDWENVSGKGVRTESVPRWLHGLLRYLRAVIPGTGTGEGGWQLYEKASGFK